MTNFEVMKWFKPIASILTIAALFLTAWCIYELISGDGDIVQSSLNLIYFFTLFIALLCARISMGLPGRITLLTYALSIFVIISSTYTWIDSTELFVAGQYTIGLLPILIGTTMISNLTSTVKWSKYAQLSVGLMVLALSACVFTGAFGTSIYEILFIGMVFVTIVVLGLSFFARST
jgi:hypothetical protein